jgi:uncharacterized protein YodC (DUF2158 family)
MFNLGDVVQLKSGGPAMTITSIEDEGGFYCIWFDGNKQTGGTFKGVVLKAYGTAEQPQKSARGGPSSQWG